MMLDVLNRLRMWKRVKSNGSAWKVSQAWIGQKLALRAKKRIEKCALNVALKFGFLQENLWIRGGAYGNRDF